MVQSLLMWDLPLDLHLVEDDAALAHQLLQWLPSSGLHTQWVRHGEFAGRDRTHPPDLVVFGYGEADHFRLKDFQMLTRTLPGTRIIVTIPDSLESYDELLRQSGAHITLSRAMPPRLLAQLIADQAEIRRLDTQNYRLQQMLDGRTSYEHLVGGSAPMRALYRLLDQVARTDTNILITGEPGTERAAVGRAIHARSERSPHPVVVAECRGKEDDGDGVFLFGMVGRGEHGLGPCPKQSAFARAGKGTLIVNEIESLHAHAQRRLLHFLHRPFFQNESAGEPQPLARLLVTAGSNLLARVEEGLFLRELYYRINILQVRVPPLRERREDIPMLAQHYLRTAGQPSRGSGTPRTFSPQALLCLFQYDWPGNVAELESMAEKLGGTAHGLPVEVDELPEVVRQASSPPKELQAGHGRTHLPLKEAKRQFESEYFKGLLQRTRGNMTLASRYSRVGRPYLYKKIHEYGICPEQFR